MQYKLVHRDLAVHKQQPEILELLICQQVTIMLLAENSLWSIKVNLTIGVDILHQQLCFPLSYGLKVKERTDLVGQGAVLVAV